MTEITDAPTLAADNGENGGTRATARRRPGSGLTAMVLPELQALASSMGISGTARMRKGELIAAIQSRQAPAAAPKAAVNGAPNAAATSSAVRDDVSASTVGPAPEITAATPAARSRSTIAALRGIAGAR